MQFDSSYITTAGSELFARATASTSGGASKPIVWGSVYTSLVDMRSYSPEQIRALTSIPESERSSSGSVTSASHDIIDGNHVAKLECEIRNNQYSGIAYAIGVYAKLQGDANEILAAIARVDTGGSDPDTVPESGDYLAIIDFMLTVRDDQLNLLEAPASYYASAQALQSLTNRVVTTHVENNNNNNNNITGEQQDIYGIKTFKDDIQHTGNITPSNNFTVDLGGSTHNYRSVFARTVNQSVMECSTAANIAAKLVVSAQAPDFNMPISGDRILVKFTNGNSSAIPAINIGGSGEYDIIGLRTDLSAGSVVPLTFNGSSWNVDGFLSTTNQVSMTVNNDDSEYSIIFTNTQRTRPISGVPINKELYIDLGTDGNLKYNPGTNTLLCTTFDGNATTATTATSANKWTTARSFYITTSDGAHTGSAVSVDGSNNVTLKLPSTIVIPSMSQISSSSSYFKVDIGGIFLACISYTAQNSSNTARVGYTVTVDSSGQYGDWEISQAEFNNSTGWGAAGATGSIPAGTYKFLSEVSLSSTVKHSMMRFAGQGLALMMRIS